MKHINKRILEVFKTVCIAAITIVLIDYDMQFVAFIPVISIFFLP